MPEMELEVYEVSGVPAGRTVRLDESVFGQDPNDHVLWLDVRRTQASARQGTHKTKERGEVRGSTRKLYRQKGTGHARAGMASSPIRRGGGRTFGPRPRTYRLRLSRKTRQLARRSALSYKMQSDAVRVIEELNYEAPSTRSLRTLVDGLELDQARVLILTAENRPAVHKSCRNLSRIVVREARSATTEDILRAAVLVCEEDALQTLSEFLGAA